MGRERLDNDDRKHIGRVGVSDDDVRRTRWGNSSVILTKTVNMECDRFGSHLPRLLNRTASRDAAGEIGETHPVVAAGILCTRPMYVRSIIILLAGNEFLFAS